MKNFNNRKNLGLYAMNTRDLYLEFLRHYLGYASNGELQGYDDPETVKIDKFIEKKIGPVWSSPMRDKTLGRIPSMREYIINAAEKLLNTYYSIGDSPESRIEQLDVIWPKLEKWIKYSDLDDQFENTNESIKNTDKITLTFGQLKKLINESRF